MGSEKSQATAAFPSAREADRRIAGVAAAARAARAMADAGAVAVRLEVGGEVPLSSATLEDIERLRGVAAVTVERFISGRPFSPVPSAWQIVRRTGKPGDGIVSRWLNRPISQRITLLALIIPSVRPVHATAATALIALAMFASLLAGGEAGLVLGGILFHAASVSDGVDGEMARATYRSSPAGAALDSAVDLATNVLFVLGLTAALAARDGPFYAWLGGWGLGLVVIGTMLIGRARGRGGFDLVKTSTARRASAPLVAALVRAATIVTSRDFFALLFMTLILVGLETAVLYVFAVAATIWLPFVALATRDSAVQHTRLTSPENVTTLR